MKRRNENNAPGEEKQPLGRREIRQSRQERRRILALLTTGDETVEEVGSHEFRPGKRRMRRDVVPEFARFALLFGTPGDTPELDQLST
jgi:hypothetical protein